MPKGTKAGTRTFEAQRGSARDYARRMAERQFPNKVSEPEVELRLISVGPKDGRYWRVQHKSNHPDAKTMETSANSFDELLELIQVILEADLDEQL